MNEVAFTVPGDPRGKGRPRATKRGAFIKLYTDSKTVNYEGLVAFAAQQAMGSRPPFDEAVHVMVRVRLCPPASTSAKKRAAMLAGEEPVFGRFDLDNVVKSVLDGANRIVFRDDRLITKLVAIKVGAETPGVDVVVRTARGAPT